MGGPDAFGAGAILGGAAALVLVLAAIGARAREKAPPQPQEPCWSHPDQYRGDLDPCAHCGHKTDGVCVLCQGEGDRARRDVCPCCREVHHNVVHLAGGRPQ